jgi:nitroreductase
MTQPAIHPLIEERWSPRVFKNIELNDQQIELLFEAARWAPSSRNSQPWRFVYASKSNSVTWLKLVDCLTDFNKDWVQSASHLILACVV